MSRGGGPARSGIAALLLVATSVSASAAGLAPAGPALAAPVCQNGSRPGSQEAKEVPWAQRWLGPEQAWPYSTGAGVRVAVVDSGVDPVSHLGNRVARGKDLVDPTGDGRLDCAGHGTAVAAIVAGGTRPDIGFVGIAPGATIVPVRVTDTDVPVNSDPAAPTVPASRMAAGIDAAVAAQARVVVVSLVLFDDEYVKDTRGRLVGVVEAAVRRAVARDVLVVAAVGDGHQIDPRTEPSSVPARYPGVLGVGAIGPQGSRVPKSQVGDYVDVAAPGGELIAANRLETYATVNGTSFAAGYVGGVAALVRARVPRLTAAAVANRLVATASPAIGGDRSMEYGHGIVDPYAAVTATLAAGSARPAEPVELASENPAALEAEETSGQIDARAFAAGAAALAVVTVVAVGALVVPRARRRRWSAGRSPAPSRGLELDEADEVFYTPPGLRTRR